ncbi:hypothetical protein [Mixta sp. Marseille-Q2659]|uniref:hypothetical protein n=1 Tax=Mixta sp. Marseille-Q2659 TaxID=2736607 RepID=UPI0023B9F294|nr:hypothetical protein [Mixta sp. Marseille-Q2659]
MKFLLLILSIISPVAMAKQMEGFDANYYRDDLSVSNYDTNKSLVPDVIIGDTVFVMAFSKLADITETTGVAVIQGDQASWLCLASNNVNYWFISDNEMGQGDLTSIAIAKAGRQKGCSSYHGDLSVTVKGIPLLSASLENVSSTFSNKPNGNIIQYCTDTKSYGDFTQMNCLQYYLKNKKIIGLFISQVTSN